MISKDKGIYQAIDAVRATLYPDRCSFCGKVIVRKTGLCNNCAKQENIIAAPKCYSCGKNKKQCKCNQKSTFYQAITAPYYYTGLPRSGIIRWKYGNASNSVKFFAKRVAECIKNDFDVEMFDIITFVPQTAKELSERGSNQSEKLADEISQLLNIPSKPLLIKLFETHHQHDMPWYLKSGNIFATFDCIDTQSIKNKNILLIDDIKTSGHTLNECAKVLHLSDAANVYCAVIGIT